MPRKTVTASNIKFQTILNFFRTSSLEIADFAIDLCNEAVKERHAKGKAVLAGRAGKGGATEAVDAATRSAVGAPLADGAVPVKERKKPGPPKGTGKGKRKKGVVATGGEAVGDAAAAAPDAAGGYVPEVTSADALPPQDGVLDLDK